MFHFVKGIHWCMNFDPDNEPGQDNCEMGQLFSSVSSDHLRSRGDGVPAAIMGAFSEFSWIQIYWMAQNALILPSIILMKMGHEPVDKSAGEPSLGSQTTSNLRFYQFRKRIHHYYFAGLMWVGWLTWTALGTYCMGVEPRASLSSWIQTAIIPHTVSTDATSTLLACSFFLLQLVRRLYESTRVSIFSRRQLLNPVDIVLSFAFYGACGLSLLAEAPALESVQDCISWSSLHWYHLAGAALFLWASIHHHRCHRILAKLRRNKAGHIVTTGYKVPFGDWFQYVSCPHYFCEALIYASIGVMMGGRNTTWWWLTSYVTLTQVFLAMNTHPWYNLKFDNYPQNRKMLVPFVF